jgi:hypothetical protein
MKVTDEEKKNVKKKVGLIHVHQLKHNSFFSFRYFFSLNQYNTIPFFHAINVLRMNFCVQIAMHMTERSHRIPN